MDLESADWGVYGRTRTDTTDSQRCAHWEKRDKLGKPQKKRLLTYIFVPILGVHDTHVCIYCLGRLTLYLHLVSASGDAAA